MTLYLADFPQRVLKRDSPVTSSHGESEAAATDDVVGARYIAPPSKLLVRKRATLP